MLASLGRANLSERTRSFSTLFGHVILLRDCSHHLQGGHSMLCMAIHTINQYTCCCMSFKFATIGLLTCRRHDCTALVNFDGFAF